MLRCRVIQRIYICPLKIPSDVPQTLSGVRLLSFFFALVTVQGNLMFWLYGAEASKFNLKETQIILQVVVKNTPEWCRFS